MAATTVAKEQARGRSLTWRIHVAWAQLGVLGAILLMIPFGREVDPDFWWHLRTGGLIYHSGIPRHDVYSFTVNGHSWLVHEWLSELIIYAVESVFGYVGNVLLFGAATLTAVGLMYTIGRRAGAGTKPLILLFIPTTVLLGSFVTVRPQVFTWLLFTAFVYIIERHERGDRVPLWALPALMALWVNLHLGFVYGLVAVGAWLATKVWQRARNGEVRLQTPLAIAGACLLAALLNPHGPAIFSYLAHYFVAGKTERSLIQEWQRPYFGLTIAWPLLLASVLIVLSVLSRSRPSVFLCVVALIAVGLSAQAARNIPFVALLLPAVAGTAAAGRWRAFTSAADSRLRIRMPVAVALVAFVGAFTVIASGFLQGATSGWRPSSRHYPSAAVDYLERQPSGVRVLPLYQWGGYVIDRLYPKSRVFIDGRADVYGPDVLNDYIDIGTARPGWQTLLEQYEIDAVLLPPSAPLSIALHDDPAWQEVYKGTGSELFVKRSREADGAR